MADGPGTQPARRPRPETQSFRNRRNPLTEATLSSDAQLEEAEALLLEAQAQSTALDVFSTTDIENLAERLSILEYEAGEIVMQKGEIATWVGIVLSGDLTACSPEGTVYAHMRTGTIVGEFSFFAGGRRATDVKGAEKGFVAMVTMAHIAQMFKAVPHTAHRLVHVFGSSSVHKLAFNPSQHKPLAWNMAPSEAWAAVSWWRETHLPVHHELDISDAEFEYLAGCLDYHSFRAGELLVDRFAKNERVVFVLSGEAQLVVRDAEGVGEVKLASRGPGQLLSDVSYFDANAMPCDAVATSVGVLAGLRHDTLRDMAVEQPMLGLALMRMIGTSAVTLVSPAAPAQKEQQQQASAPSSANRARRGSVAGSAAAGRRGSVAGVGAQQEVFYRNKMAKQKAASEAVVEEAKQAEKEAKQARHQLDNAKILERKIEAEKTAAQKELLEQKELVRATQNAVKNLRLELQQAQESEADFRRLATAREEEARVRREAEAELREELQELRQANRLDELEETQAEAEAATRRAERNAAEAAARGVELAEARAALAAREAELAARADEAANEVEAAAATRAVLCAELASAERLARDEGARSAHARAEVRRTVQLAQLDARLLGGELVTAETACAGLAKTARQQKLAVKALAVWDLMQMVATRRKLAKVTQQLAQAQAIVVELPFRNKLLTREKVSLEADLIEARRTLQPLQEALQAERARCGKLQREIDELHRRDGDLRAGLETTEERNRSLVASVTSAQLAKARTQEKLATSQQAAHEASHKLSRQRHEQAALEHGLLAMTRRVNEIEASFGQLLAPGFRAPAKRSGGGGLAVGAPARWASSSAPRPASASPSPTEQRPLLMLAPAPRDAAAWASAVVAGGR